MAFPAVSYGMKTQEDPIGISTSKGTVEITPLNDNIFKVSLLPEGERKEPPRSQAQVLNGLPSRIKTSDTPQRTEIASPTTRIIIDKDTGRISFLDASGKRLLTEADGIDNSNEIKSVSLVPDGQQAFYGAGERGHRLKLNGDSLVMYNRQNYGYTAGDPRISQMGITVPYFVSDKGYGVLFDDYAKAGLSLGDTIVYRSETDKPLSYFFINGNGSLAGATGQYTLLTGRQQLPPFWTLGYITSKYGYRTQDEALGTVDTLKTRGYPLDGIVLDLYWYGKETDMGRLEWNPGQWPDHKRMLAELKGKGVHTVLISQPYINKTGAIDKYNMLSAAGMLVKDSAGNTKDVTTWVGDAGMLDVSNPDTRRWMWSRYKSLTDDGVAAWWGDLGEPEVHPSGMVHDNGETTEQYHNVYGNEWSRIIHEGFRKDFPDRRIMMLMRGGTAGLQRYNAFPWSTDVSRSWGGLQPQVNIMLNSGLSGLAYMSSDIGGFAVDPEHPTDPELYVRWLQMGAFTPTLRTHAQDRPEPYNYPEMEEISKKFIRMRYEWLPYNYTLAYENVSEGLPLARPLNFRDDNPESVHDGLPDEYLWGDNVLVAPVMHKGMRSRKVSFPAGQWYDFNRPASPLYRGGSIATVEAPLDELPMFVRAGSFIPLYTKPIENTSQYNPESLTVRYYPSDERSEYTLYDDDRLSPTSIEEGKYRLTAFSGRRSGQSIEIEAAGNGGTYEGAPATQTITFEIEGVERRPTSVKVNGADISWILTGRQSPFVWTYDEQTQRFGISCIWDFSRLSLRIN